MSYYVLKKLQNERKFKRKELADLLNVGESDISKRIHGNTIFKDEEKKKVYNYLSKKGIFIGNINDLFKEDGVKKESKELELSKDDTPFQSGLKKCLQKEKETTKRTKKEICELLGIEYRTLQGYINGTPPKNEWEMILKSSWVFKVSPTFFYNNIQYNSWNNHNFVVVEEINRSFRQGLYDLLFKYLNDYFRFTTEQYNKTLEREELIDYTENSDYFWYNFDLLLSNVESIIEDIKLKYDFQQVDGWYIKKAQQVKERIEFLEKYDGINNQDEIERLKIELNTLEILKDI